MFRVIECIWTQHNHIVVALAAAIWLLGSFAFFLALERAQECRADRRASWLAVGAFAGGLGVWATHFVAMLAYQGAMPIAYAPVTTLVSAAIAITGFWSAIRLLGNFSVSRCALAGLAVALSIAAMHFTGMAAIRAQAHISYDWSAIAISALLAVALFGAAFFIFARRHNVWHVPLAALTSVIAVCALHFTGMSAATLSFDPTLPAVESSTSRIWLIGATAGSTVVVILLTGFATLVDRYLTDLRGFAEATLEGILIVRDDRIVEANDRFAAWMNTTPAAMIGVNPETLIATADGRPVTQVRDTPTEAVPRGENSERVFEVAVHEIEYRGRPSRVLAMRDLTEAKAAQRQIEHLARHDGLTALPNRRLLQERLDQALALSKRTGEPLALLALDLDRFKAVNDLFGHAEGDRVLKGVSEMLKRCVRGADTVARIGGDEFVILQVGFAQPDGAGALAHRILETFRSEMNPALDPTAVGVSIGVAAFPRDGEDAPTLHHAADVALYRAKTSGRGQVAFFDAQMDVETKQRRQLENDLRHAVARNQFHIAYQPLVATSDSYIEGYEALLRWNHPERGEVSPDEFIPIAEETGAILLIGEWVLRQACRNAAAWEDPLTLAVNISPVQFQVSNLEEIIMSALDDAGLAADRLELEITETALLKDREKVVRVLHALKARGVRVAMDDFGTGYSSLSNLQSFPFDKIKIDKSFIQSMEDDEAARSIVRAIVGIGKSLDLPVVAEGVETDAQRLMVQEEGCPQAQGFFYGWPGKGPRSAMDAVVSDHGDRAVGRPCAGSFTGS